VAKTEIVKVQKPLASTGGLPPHYMVYAYGKRHQALMPEEQLPMWAKRCFQSKEKIYCNAHRRNGHWVLGDKTLDQPW
jgi:hypothetical protein